MTESTSSAPLDLEREVDAYRARAGRLRVVEVPPLLGLAIDGSGDPDAVDRFQRAVGALSPLAHLHDVAIPAGGHRMTGRHHEISLSDARRAPASD